jgi:hypothetical protein
MTDQVNYASNGMAGRPFRTNQRLVRSGQVSSDFGEMTPVVFQDRFLLVASGLPPAAANIYKPNRCLWIEHVAEHRVISRFAVGYGRCSAFVHRDTLYVYAIPNDSSGAQHIDCFWSKDLKQWEMTLALRAETAEELFDESVCEADRRFIMAFESRDLKATPFTIYFAESRDLQNWTRLSLPVFAPERYTACPTIRYIGGWFYTLHLEYKTPDWRFETYLVRSKDLAHWESSPRNPVLDPEGPEQINASDIDLVECRGKVRAYYGTGNQKGEGGITWADFDGTLKEFFEYYYQH